MKLIAINRQPGAPIASLYAVELYPDSAPVMTDKPVFLPDWWSGTTFSAVICPAYRIGRLGKAIKPKFASRYVDAVTLAARIYPANSPVDPQISRPDIVRAWDGSVVLGRWQEPAEDRSLTIAPELSPELKLTLTPGEIDIDSMIAAVSGVMTLKMGDVILPCYIAPPVGLSIGDRIAYRLDDRPDSLIVKIK